MKGTGCGADCDMEKDGHVSGACAWGHHARRLNLRHMPAIEPWWMRKLAASSKCEPTHPSQRPRFLGENPSCAKEQELSHKRWEARMDNCLGAIDRIGVPWGADGGAPWEFWG